ncbi:putative HTH-type transcriptional regulator [Capillimicrobium parvum]|uniref:HTH-type transcriptional regulator n=2 Tax=Capillimicrobium parvum TaxID=2884022 RepID=A0A9E7BYW2_9ACTN|nr:putative HTH-type transcriptional regulator [Capillimicrobium parvum]
MNDQTRRGPGRRRDPDARRRILEATVALVAERGYAGVTKEGVAARAGVGRTTIYRWWPSKGAVVLEALRGIFEVRAPDSGDTRGDLVAYARGVAETLTATTYGAIVPGLAADLARDSELAADFRRLCVAPTRASGIQAIQRAVARGDLPEDVDAELIIDIIGGVVFLRTLVTHAPVESDLADKLVEIILSGHRV